MPSGLSILRRISHLREGKQRGDGKPKPLLLPSPSFEVADTASEEEVKKPSSDTERSPLRVFGRPRNRFNLPESIRDPVNEDMLNQLAQKKLLFVITDVSQPHQPIVFASETFLAFTGYSQAEVLNRNCSFLQGAGTGAETVQRIREAIKCRAPVEEVILNYTKSGRKFWNLLSLTPIRPRDGHEVTHYLGVQRDVSNTVEIYALSSDGAPPAEAEDALGRCDSLSLASEARGAACFRPKPPPNVTCRSARRTPSTPRHVALAPPSPNAAQFSSEFAQMRAIRESLARQVSGLALLLVRVAEDGTVVSCSDSCLFVFGRSAETLVGKPFLELVEDPEEADVWKWEPHSRIIRARHADGSTLHLMVTPAVEDFSSGERTRPISIQNVTTLKAIEEALQEKEHSLQALKLTMEHRKQFMNYIFHEVRQPFSVLMLGLRHITASCQSVLEKVAAADVQAEVRDILITTEELTQAGESMHRILNDVLSLEKLQEGKMVIERGLVEVEAIIGNAHKQTACLFQEKGITVEVTVDEQLRGLQAAYDKCRLQQVMLNLLTNAHKFTPRGGNVHLYMECTRPPTADEVELQVRVVDNGVGISKEAQQQLFKPYVQLRAGELQEGGGTGLGLAITKGIVEAHGGTLGVRAAPGEGAEFWFRLPLRRHAERRGSSAPTPPRTSPQWRQSPRERAPRPSSCNSSFDSACAADVLVVDDQALIRKYMSAALQRLHLTVTVAASGEEVVERYTRGERWRLIFSDCTMGELSGPAMTRQLLAMGCTSPIVGITGNVHMADVNDFLAAGARQVCTKPVRVDLLAQCTEEYLGLCSRGM
eukprot:EG_transcript_1400